jgi:hypothetical protein
MNCYDVLDFLKIALEAHWWLGSPLRVTMPLCKRIRLSIPKMEKIWKLSQMSKTRDESLSQALNFEVYAARDILEGKLTLDDVGELEVIVSDPGPSSRIYL